MQKFLDSQYVDVDHKLYWTCVAGAVLTVWLVPSLYGLAATTIRPVVADP